MKFRQMSMQPFTLRIVPGLFLAALLLTQCQVPTGGRVQPNSLAATKEAPFVNSLGMKFVPVPGTQILMCTTETTVSQYRLSGGSVPPPEFPQDGNHPVVNVDWNQSKAWCDWLSQKEGRKYRLPTESEWKKAIGSAKYPWGNSWPPPNYSGNYSGQEWRNCSEDDLPVFYKIWSGGVKMSLIGGFSDNHLYTAPVGSYAANGLGIHDLGGNVWEWTMHWIPESYESRYGGSFTDFDRDYMTSAARNVAAIHRTTKQDEIGFRCVLVR